VTSAVCALQVLLEEFVRAAPAADALHFVVPQFDASNLS
jgi:hypothetical protein